jgi:lysophospholipase L1-like esterase
MHRTTFLFVALILSGATCAWAQKLPESGIDPIAQYRAAATEKWETAIKKLEELDKTQPDPPQAVLFIGSSSIRLWKDLAADMAPRGAINRGYGGARFSDLVVFVERLVQPHKCEAIVIFVANDIVGKEDDKTPEEVAGLFKYAVGKIRQSHSEQPIFLVAITPTPSRFTAWSQIRLANAELEKVCKAGSNLHFIATESHYLDQHGQPIDRYFVEDKLHQNRDGYLVWGKIIKGQIDSILPVPKQ